MYVQSMVCTRRKYSIESTQKYLWRTTDLSHELRGESVCPSPQGGIKKYVCPYSRYILIIDKKLCRYRRPTTDHKKGMSDNSCGCIFQFVGMVSQIWLDDDICDHIVRHW